MDASVTAVDRHAEQEAEDMVALTSAETGIANTIFVSPKGFARHAARLKVAIDPPDISNAKTAVNSLLFDTTAKTASMALHDHAVSGERIPAHLVRQLEAFIEINRRVLLDYWENRIATAELLRRLKSL
jgi:hypothetical protein